jgi:MraZ protein
VVNNRCEVANPVANTIVLAGEHELNIDEKGRLLIPADFRRELETHNEGTYFFLVIGVDGRPWLYPKSVYHDLVSKREQDVDLEPTAARLDFEETYFGMACPNECDKQGRILIPEKMLKRTNLEREVIVMGCGNYMRIWNRSAWDAKWPTLLQKQRKQYAASAGLTGLPDVGEVSRPSG